VPSKRDTPHLICALKYFVQTNQCKSEIKLDCPNKCGTFSKSKYTVNYMRKIVVLIASMIYKSGRYFTGFIKASLKITNNSLDWKRQKGNNVAFAASRM
jgi:hypothetical protein